jgi:peroxiredoxin
MNHVDLSFQSELDRFRQHFESRAGSVVSALINSATLEIKSGARIDLAMGIGKTFPAARSLVDTDGKKFDLRKVLQESPTLLLFYRGNWCPYCKLTLRAFQAVLPDIERAGYKLFAISPELPEHAASLAEKHFITFPLLSDRDGKLIQTLGIGYELPENLKPLFEKGGHALPEHNGTDSWLLPLTSIFAIEPPGIVRDRVIAPDHTQRGVLMSVLNQLQDKVVGATT